MLKLLKYWWMVGTFRQVAEVYREEQGKNKPLFISRRFMGVVCVAIALALAKFQVAEVSEQEANLVADYLIEIIAGIYGLIQLVVGIWKREKKTV